MEPKTIKITCKGAWTLPTEALLEFQGNLKTLSEPDYKKLKSSIVKHGFSFPFFIWNDGKNNHIIDGHQRLHVVKKMVEEGWKIEGGKLPVDLIEADDIRHAKEKVLLAISQYGKLDYESTYEFIQIEKLDFSSIKDEADLPGINMEFLDQGYFEGKPQNLDYGGMPEFKNDNILNRFVIIMRFKDEESMNEFITLTKIKLLNKGKTKSAWFPPGTEKEMNQTGSGLVYEENES